LEIISDASPDVTTGNSPITYHLSNFITGCRSLGDKIIEVLLYVKYIRVFLFFLFEIISPAKSYSLHGKYLVKLKDLPPFK